MPLGKERIVICRDCGAEVKTRASRTLRCKECAQKHIQEKRKLTLEKFREKRRNEEIAEYEKFTYQFCDSPENIQKCLNCERAKCVNCLSPANQRYAKRKAERSGANG